ncbi:U-box domain-containing protein 27-like [Phoenix dactylifera]|uniref:U-box domain-containing protein n=1 Tax=Phoenix dactylifera TaxID=42345 RepID=A0A8B7CI41_PHODC|nr:U-box domain-containing protein 27-like [Phoenix dactylifera]
MGRKEERLREALQVKIPSYFRCPISLDVMKSPVSLCTGVTYDRASIQRWLDSGNTTCPATRQPLPSTDLVPNLTLRRLIHLWSSTSSSSPADVAVPHRQRGGDILREVRSASADPRAALRRLADFFSDDENDEFERNNLVDVGGCAAVLVSILVKKKIDDDDGLLETSEAAIRVLALILTSDFIEEGNKKIAISALISDLNGSISALLSVLKKGSSLESRIDAARVLESIIGSPETKLAIAEEEEVIAELIRLIGPSDDKGTMDRKAVEAGLGCLAGIAGVRRARVRMARLGVVAAATRVLAAKAEVAPAAAERAMRVLEAAAACAEGRAAICEAAEESVGTVVGRMMKIGREGKEAAVAVLWMVCHYFRDRRAVEAAAALDGGLTKILLLMQSGCSPATRQMAADLLKIFRVNSKSCLAGYDTKTTHIMPF